MRTPIDGNDIALRLRSHHTEGVTSSDRFHLRNEAAKEIDSLRAERDALKEALHEVVCGWHDIDARIRYVEVQVDKEEMRRIYEMLGLAAPVFK